MSSLLVHDLCQRISTVPTQTRCAVASGYYCVGLPGHRRGRGGLVVTVESLNAAVATGIALYEVASLRAQG